MDFMDSLRRGVDRAGFEVDRLLRANRVRSRIGTLRSQVDDEIRQIGQRMLEMFDRGEQVPENLREYYDRIRDFRTEIERQEAELVAIENEAPPEIEPIVGTATGLGGSREPLWTSCPSCGRGMPPDANFCPNCGYNVKAAQEAPLGSQSPEQGPTS